MIKIKIKIVMYKAFLDLPKFLEIADLRPKVKNYFSYRVAHVKPSSTSIIEYTILNFPGRSLATEKKKLKQPGSLPRRSQSKILIIESIDNNQM